MGHVTNNRKSNNVQIKKKQTKNENVLIKKKRKEYMFWTSRVIKLIMTKAYSKILKKGWSICRWDKKYCHYSLYLSKFLLYKRRGKQWCPLLKCLFFPLSLSKLQKECQNQNRHSKKTIENKFTTLTHKSLTNHLQE